MTVTSVDSAVQGAHLLLTLMVAIGAAGQDVRAAISSCSNTPLCVAVLHTSATPPFVGTVAGFNRENSCLLWMEPDTTEPVEIDVADIKTLVLAGHRRKTVRIPLETVILTNGDRIKGDLFSLDERTVTLDTGYAGTLRFPRGATASIRSRRGQRVFYEGPRGDLAWTCVNATRGTPSNHGMTLRSVNDSVPTPPSPEPGHSYVDSDGYLVAPPYSSVFMTVTGMPDSCEFLFTLRGTESCAYSFLFFADAATGGTTSGFKFDVNNWGMALTAIPQGFDRFIPAGLSWRFCNAVDPAVRTESRFRIQANRANGYVAVYLNDVRIISGNADTNIVRRGDVLAFTRGAAASSPFGIGRILFSEWNGRPPAMARASLSTADQLVLRNGDLLVGRLRAITGGVASIRSDLGTFDIPLSRIETVVLATDASAPAPSSTFRLGLPDDGNIGAERIRMDAVGVSFSNAILGDVTVPLAAIDRIDFSVTNGIPMNYPKPAENAEFLPNPIDAGPTLRFPIPPELVAEAAQQAEQKKKALEASSGPRGQPQNE